ncbi:GIY-YIG nuclease family protein [Nocardioides bigeumensis]|uniref:GIY-YIG nuclease family protein n=1 Tax=Nocardioides bigeumensis TaxID=433657 RepID=A0ABP5JSI5_9ACTN
MAWVYILRCSDDSYYVGSTTNIEARLYQHQVGEGAAYTRRRRPVELVWSCQFERVDEAFAFEKRVQNWSRAKREALIEGRWDDLPLLARGRTGWIKRGHPDSTL